jgi:hypothetical protein
MTLVFNKHLIVDMTLDSRENGVLRCQYPCSTTQITVSHQCSCTGVPVPALTTSQHGFVGYHEMTGDLDRITALKTLDVRCLGFSFVPIGLIAGVVSLSWRSTRSQRCRSPFCLPLL